MAIPREITQRQLRNESGAVMRSIDCGETFIVTRNGVPIATLSPLHSARFTKAAAAIAAFRGVAPTDFVRFRADLDAHIDEDPTPRA